MLNLKRDTQQQATASRVSLRAHYQISNTIKILARGDVPLNECSPHAAARGHLCQGFCDSDHPWAHLSRLPPLCS